MITLLELTGASQIAGQAGKGCVIVRIADSHASLVAGVAHYSNGPDVYTPNCLSSILPGCCAFEAYA
jgi:hypothetical protein